MTPVPLVQFLPLFLVAAGAYVLVRVARRRSSNSSPFSRGPHIVRFRNPANGYEEEIGTPWVWSLLFGGVYFAARGV